MTTPDDLRQHVARFNLGVRSGDFSAMTAALTPDAVMVFAGPPVGPFHGRDAIAAAYVENPPDDEIVLLAAEPGDGRACAEYAWALHPDLPAGRLCIEMRGDLISRVEISFHAT